MRRSNQLLCLAVYLLCFSHATPSAPTNASSLPANASSLPAAAPETAQFGLAADESSEDTSTGRLESLVVPFACVCR